MTQKAEIFYEEEAYFSIVGRPAVGYLRVVDYGADHACALALDLHGLNDAGLPEEEGLFVKLLEGEEIDGLGFHSDFLIKRE